MNQLPRTIAWVGVLLIIIGAIAGGIGGYELSSNQCTSGYQLTVDSENQNTAATSQRTNFSSLSPTDQRLFLEAVTAPNHRSKTYGSTGPFENITQTQIVYRNQTYVTNVLAVDCGTPSGLLTAIGGGISLVLGILCTLYASIQYRESDTN